MVACYEVSLNWELSSVIKWSSKGMVRLRQKSLLMFCTWMFWRCCCLLARYGMDLFNTNTLGNCHNFLCKSEHENYTQLIECSEELFSSYLFHNRHKQYQHIDLAFTLKPLVYAKTFWVAVKVMMNGNYAEANKNEWESDRVSLFQSLRDIFS